MASNKILRELSFLDNLPIPLRVCDTNIKAQFNYRQVKSTPAPNQESLAQFSIVSWVSTQKQTLWFCKTSHRPGERL